MEPSVLRRSETREGAELADQVCLIREAERQSEFGSLADQRSPGVFHRTQGCLEPDHASEGLGTESEVVPKQPLEMAGRTTEGHGECGDRLPTLVPFDSEDRRVQGSHRTRGPGRPQGAQLIAQNLDGLGGRVALEEALTPGGAASVPDFVQRHRASDKLGGPGPGESPQHRRSQTSRHRAHRAAGRQIEWFAELPEQKGPRIVLDGASLMPAVGGPVVHDQLRPTIRQDSPRRLHLRRGLCSLEGPEGLDDCPELGGRR